MDIKNMHEHRNTEELKNKWDTQTHTGQRAHWGGIEVMWSLCESALYLKD